MKNRITLIVPALALAAAAGLTACQPSSSSAGAPPSGLASAAKGIADIPGVQSDEQAASNLAAACVKTGHIKTTVSCLKKDVPAAKRDALGTCLGESALKGWAQFKATGAQHCVAIALAPASASASAAS